MRRRLASSLAFAVVLAGCSGPPSAPPSTQATAAANPSPEVSAIPSPASTASVVRLDTQLAFNHYAGGLVTLWADTGTAVGPLFPTVGDEQEDASWSSDGGLVVFQVLLPSGARIFQSLAGAAPTEVATGCKPPECLEDGYPSVSPDGAHLAFRRLLGDAEPTASGIVIADISGAHPKTLTNVPWSKFEDSSPSWSPDGKAVVFARQDHDSSGNVSGSSLYIVTVATGDVRRLTLDGVSAADPDWSSTGLIVFGTPIDSHNITTGDISVIAPDGTGLRGLTAGTPLAGAAGTPSWIEGGTRIVFGHIDSASTGGIWVMNADGSQPEQVTTAAGFNAYPAVSPN